MIMPRARGNQGTTRGSPSSPPASSRTTYHNGEGQRTAHMHGGSPPCLNCLRVALPLCEDALECCDGATLDGLSEPASDGDPGNHFEDSEIQRIPVRAGAGRSESGDEVVGTGLEKSHDEVDPFDVSSDDEVDHASMAGTLKRGRSNGTSDAALRTLLCLPNELLFHILSFLDVFDLLSTSRVSRLLRQLSLTPLLHHYRLRRNRLLLPPLLASPCRPSLAELIARSIFLTRTSVVSRRLGRSLVSIRLSRRLAARPSVEALVDRAVLPKECVPGMARVYVAPALVAKRKAIEKERTKDTLRRWIGANWRGQVREREEGVRKLEETRGIGRVWRLRRFWERVSRGDVTV